MAIRALELKTARQLSLCSRSCKDFSKRLVNVTRALGKLWINKLAN